MLGRWWLAYRCWRRRRLRRRAARYRGMVARFVASRRPQSDAEFFAECLPGAPPEWMRWAIAVRWAIARLGRVHPRWIRSDDRFADLMGLPGWCFRGDAFFDVGGFVMLIEEATGLSLRDADLERLPNVDAYDDQKVRDFVVKATELFVGKSTPGVECARRHLRTAPNEPDSLG